MDIDGDGSSTMDDVYAMAATWLLHNGDAGFADRADLNHDGVVNNIDADILAGNWKVVLQNAARYYYHFNGLGSVVALSDKNGQTVETYQYSVFGDTAVYNAAGTRLAASAVGNVYFFTARRLDTETQLYYYRARMYTPHLGRFLQTDPIGYGDSMCLYQYALNNPVIILDPYGLSAWARFTGVLQGVGGVLEAAAGGTVAFVTSSTVVGAIAGGAVAVHGIDTAQAGFHQAWTGEYKDTVTSKGMQAAGVPRSTANLVDAGIGVVGSLGTGSVNASAKLAKMSALDDAAGMSKLQMLTKWEKGSKALPYDDFTAIVQNGGTNPFLRADMVSSGLHPWEAFKIANTGLTPMGDIFGAAALIGTSEMIDYGTGAYNDNGSTGTWK